VGYCIVRGMPFDIPGLLLLIP